LEIARARIAVSTAVITPGTASALDVGNTAATTKGIVAAQIAALMGEINAV
jgi:hypothetical protein